MLLNISELTYVSMYICIVLFVFQEGISAEDFGDIFAHAIDSSQLVLWVVIGILVLIVLAAINYIFRIRKNKRLGDKKSKGRVVK